MASDIRNFDEALSEIGIFRTITPEERMAIARQCAWNKVDANTQIINHLDDSSDVYFVVQGRLRAINYSIGGKEVSFRDIPPGEMFGEFAAIDGQARSANVFAIEDAFIGSLTAEAFADVMVRHPAVALEMMRRLTGQIRTLTERIFEFSTMAVNNRIHAELLRLSMASGVEGNVSILAPPPTHAEIASRVSTHREAVTREINRLAQKGLLAKEKRTLIVTDFAALQELVGMDLGE